MNRRNFLQLVSTSGGILATTSPLLLSTSARAADERKAREAGKGESAADVIIAGGGVGGCAAALSALRRGLRVVMTEETDWIGGQITQQGVPPDEHRWIEQFGGTRAYREFRTAVREYYKRNYPLTADARSRWNLNPGDGAVSKLCHEPRVALAVLNELFNPFLSTRQLIILLEHKVMSADVDGDKVRALKAKSLRTGNEVVLTAPFFIDATELGDLLPLTKTEFVIGAESKKQTGELHATDEAESLNQQAITACFAMDYVAGENHVMEKPREYDFWRDYVPKMQPAWPGKLLSFTTAHPKTLEERHMRFDPEGEAKGGDPGFFRYRRIANKDNFAPGTYRGDITIVNWPQNDYLLGPLLGVSEEEAAKHVNRAKQLSLSLLYWMQTEAPRPDGKQGFPELRLRNDVLGTEDGLAKYVYIREARRIKAMFTVLEQHVGRAGRAQHLGKPEADVVAETFPDTVGIGYYNIDLHPSTNGRNYIDVSSLPFQIPLGALVPQRVQNLIPACKNIGTTHITNGCYRLHPVEWNIGESAGALVAYSLEKKTTPKGVRESKARLADFQNRLRQSGVEVDWPKGQF